MSEDECVQEALGDLEAPPPNHHFNLLHLSCIKLTPTSDSKYMPLTLAASLYLQEVISHLP